jgi:hypothetical protein
MWPLIGLGGLLAYWAIEGALNKPHKPKQLVKPIKAKPIKQAKPAKDDLAEKPVQPNFGWNPSKKMLTMTEEDLQRYLESHPGIKVN